MTTHLRYQRRFSAGPVHFNVSRSGLGMSVGVKGMRWGVSSTGQHYSSVGVPFVPGARWVSYSHTDHHSRGVHFSWVIWLILCLVIWKACA